MNNAAKQGGSRSILGDRVLYRYMKVDGALATLRHRTHRMRCPLTFNDPFDVRLSPFVGIDVVECIARTTEHALQIVKAGNPALAYVSETALHPYFQRWINLYETGHQTLALAEMDARIEEGWHRYITEGGFRKLWLPLLSQSAMLCVSEHRAHPLMLAHYAQHHAGFVFGLRAVPALNTALCAARPVRYEETMPTIADADRWSRCFILGENPLPDDLGERVLFTKSTVWRYEAEWRVWWRHRAPLPGGDHVDVPFFPAELVSIGIGCRASDENIDTLMRLLDVPDYAHVSVYRLVARDNAFEFDEVSKREGQRVKDAVAVPGGSPGEPL